LRDPIPLAKLQGTFVCLLLFRFAIAFETWLRKSSGTDTNISDVMYKANNVDSTCNFTAAESLPNKLKMVEGSSYSVYVLSLTLMGLHMVVLTALADGTVAA